MRDYIGLVDLSPEGCCVLSRQPLLKIGQRVTLQPESLSGLQACVQWTHGCLAGLRFDNPLYGPVYEHLARTFAGGKPESSGAPWEVESPQQVSESFLEEVQRKIKMAEAKDSANDQGDIERYRRMIHTAARPGFRSRQTEGQVLKLFLS